MALQASASDTLRMQDGTDQFIDRAIGIAGAACGIGLALKIVGWVAGVHDLDPVGNWLCAPVALGLASYVAVKCVTAWLPAARYLVKSPSEFGLSSETTALESRTR
jgi:hypothetical protein